MIVLKSATSIGYSWGPGVQEPCEAGRACVMDQLTSLVSSVMRCLF